MTALVFRPLASNTFSLADENIPLAKIRFSAWQGEHDLFAPCDLFPDISDYNFGTWQLTSRMIPGLTFSIVANREDLNTLHLTIHLINNTHQSVRIDRIELPEIQLDPASFSAASHPWTMQGAAVGWGQDFAFELPTQFERDNYLGHLQDAEGGGIPVNYFWNRDRGLALMHNEANPVEWYMPVKADDQGILTALELRRPFDLTAGQSLLLPEVVISVHNGDFFEPLALYRKLISTHEMAPAEPSPACFEPAWCSWGYEFDVTSAQMLGVLPALKELNIHWLTLDDRWFDAYGDWNPRTDTFPGGGAEMREMNRRIHAAGGLNQIWWYPLCAEDGSGEWESHRYGVSQILKEHPDWVVLDEHGQVARNNRHIAMLCPALPEVQAYTRDLVDTFIADWGFDGHKLDNIYTMPSCHNPAHHHTRPEESIEAFGAVYKMIFDRTRELKPNSVTQICPCGTPITHNLLPAVDQTVTADPTSSAQIRQRIKFYKGLMGPRAAIFADHVELSDESCDFASEIGTGGVPATKFVFPEDENLRATLKEYWSFPPEKQIAWKRWFDFYNQHRPAEGEYLNLYDQAFDQPEGHAIRKGNGMYYGFFAPEFDGQVELRGLQPGEYQVIEYTTGQELGQVDATQPFLQISFKHAALLLAIPRSVTG